MIQLEEIEQKEILFSSEKTVVFRGEHPVSKLPIVIKTINSDFYNEYELYGLEREFEILNLLKGSHVPDALELIKSSSGAAIIFKDQNLVSLEQHFKSEPIDAEAFFDIAFKTLKALKAIHAYKIIHKDINPSNILLDQVTKQVFITDFGLSSPFSSEAATTEGKFSGTLNYMPPEQTGRVNRAPDHRSDIYSLGITFYKLLTGAPPFSEQDPVALIYAHLTKDIPVIKRDMIGIKTINTIIATMVQKSPEQRYQSCDGILFDLEFARKNSDQNSFDPRSHDVPLIFCPSSKIYGRSSAIETIRKATFFASKGEKSFVSIRGKQGTGKSVLAEYLQRNTEKQEGWYFYFAFSGSVDQKPFSAFLNIAEKAAEQIQVLSEKQAVELKNRVRDKMGPSLVTLLSHLPSLAVLYPEIDTTLEEADQKSKAKLRYALLEFFKSIITNQYPIGIFIDDWQWSDHESTELLEDLMISREIRYLSVVTTCREEEEKSTNHPYAETLAKIEKEELHSYKISLHGLTPDDLIKLLEDSLGKNDQDVKNLNNYLMKVTGGTPYFIHQVLQSLAEKEILVFDSNTKSWIYDPKRLGEIRLIGGMVDLAKDRINLVTDKTRELINLASCIHMEFSLVHLAKAASLEMKECIKLVREAERQGILVKTNNNFKFGHFEIREFIYGQIEAEQRIHIHASIGTKIKGTTKLSELDKIEQKIAIEQFNASWPVSNNLVDPMELCKANLELGQKTLKNLILNKAEVYLTMSVKVADHIGTPETRSTKFQALQALSDVYLIHGYLDKAEDTLRQARIAAKTNVEKIDNCLKTMHLKLVQTNYKSALQVTRECLELIGRPFPKHITIFHAIYALIKTRRAFKKTNESWLTQVNSNLPPFYGQLKRAIRTACELGAAIADPKLMLYGFLENTQITIDYGASKNSGGSLMAYAIIMLKIGKFDEAMHAANLGMTFPKRFPQAETSAVTLWIQAIMIEHFKHDIHATLRRIEETDKVAKQLGDVLTQVYCASAAPFLQIVAGQKLSTIVSLLPNQGKFFNRYQMDFSILGPLIFNDYLYEISGESWETAIKEGFNQQVQMTEFDPSKHDDRINFIYYHFEFEKNLWRENYDEAFRFAKLSQKIDEHVKLMPFFWYHRLLFVSLLGCMGTQKPKNERRKYIALIKKEEGKFKQWARFNPTFFDSFYHYVLGEKYWLQGKYSMARANLAKAVTMIRKQNLPNFEARFAYRMKCFCVDRGEQIEANAYSRIFRNALTLWGANQVIKKHFSEIVEKSLATTISTSTTFNASVSTRIDNPILTSSLDLSRLQQASVAIMGEIDLERSLHVIIYNILQLSGSTRGVIFNKYKDQIRPVVEAKLVFDGNIVVWHKDALSKRGCGHPKSIVFKTLQKGQIVLINNVEENSEYRNDPFFRTQEVKSILCSALTHQNETISVLYLENDKLPENYTRERLSSIDVLSAQAAISLRNAMLHTESLQQVAIEKELEAAKIIQKALLPVEQAIENVKIATHYQAAESAGGDWYHYHHDKQNNVLYCVVGDVTGHGISSAMLTGVVYGAVTAFFNQLQKEQVESVDEVLKSVSEWCDRVISDAGMRTDRWMTMLIAAIDLSTGEGRLVNNGHQNAILIGQSKVKSIVSQGFILGRQANHKRHVAQFKMSPRDQLFLYSDGLIENNNRLGKELTPFGLCRILGKQRGNPADVCESLVGEKGTLEPLGPQDDDCTMLIVEWEGYKSLKAS